MTTLHHLMILDSSGSMASVKAETIEGFNGQLQTIRDSVEKHPDQKHFISLVVFGLYGTPGIEFQIWKKEIDEASDLTDETYKPSNGTPMYDGICMGIQGLRNEIVDDLKDESTKIFVTIFTDGREGGSREFSGKNCETLIGEVRETGQWEVALLGCEEDVFDVADSLGISKGNTVRYARGKVGTQAAYGALSCARMKMSDSIADGNYNEVKTSLFSPDTDTDKTGGE